ncbi:unnamed protein product [Spirodela intermedia]|uniref:EF-hand domain-containing protein n=1 Tax=Spirodela intermedia TaxID=51605 RepID=A0ABN7EAT7_SPIIN|nr:unnamed protein product [Spirodela intermedia]
MRGGHGLEPTYRHHACVVDMLTASHEECAAMIRAFDGDGDGVLNYDEFCKMMM